MAPVGYWGHPTSTLDWCETNYEVTVYVAEFWNTISNVVMIIPPLLGCLRSLKEEMEHRVTLSYFALFCVGIGSWCFHMTLLYEMQLLDELPMIWGSIVFVFVLFEAYTPPGQQSHKLVTLLVFYSVFVTVIYVTMKSPLIHQTAYAILVLTLVYKAIDVALKCDKWSRKMVVLGTIIYATGFILWNIDNLFCHHLRYIRYLLPVGLKPLAQFHLWWHFLSGYSTYLHIVFASYIRYKYLKKDFSVIWHWNLFPYLVFHEDTKNGKTGEDIRNGNWQIGNYVGNGLKNGIGKSHRKLCTM